MRDFTQPDRVERYPYPCIWKRGAHCELAFYHLADGRTVLVCTDPPDNVHTPVVIVLELLVPKICRDFQLDSEQLVWIEHYQEGMTKRDTYNLVTFKLDNGFKSLREPTWREMTPTDWSELGLFVPSTPGATHDK